MDEQIKAGIKIVEIKKERDLEKKTVTFYYFS